MAGSGPLLQHSSIGSVSESLCPRGVRGQIRRSFAYTVVTPSESQVTGCVYINPTSKRGYDAVVYLCARQSELAGGLESRLYSAVQEWIAREWPFKKVAFPGRSIDWDTWRNIPDEKR